MHKAALAIAAGAGILIMLRGSTVTFFEPSEFQGWWDQLNPELLDKLNRFRELWGMPVVVSSDPHAVGRHNGRGDVSQHNVDQWGEVRAVDVFPTVETRNGRAWVKTIAQRERAFRLATEAGFTGIGIYTDTAPGNMLHLDVRQDRAEGDPATWSRIAGNFWGIDQVLA